MGNQALRLSSIAGGFFRLSALCSVSQPDAEIKIKEIKEKKNKERVGLAKTFEQDNNRVEICASPPIGAISTVSEGREDIAKI